MAADVLDSFWAALQPQVEKAVAAGIDAIYLVLHGAMCTTSMRDVEGERLRGEVLIRQHTPSGLAQPLFGGAAEGGIGFSGTCTDTSATINGPAFVGKASLIFKATFRHLADLA